MSSGSQKQVSRKSSYQRSAEFEDVALTDEDVSDEDSRDTRDALYGYIFHRAEQDQNLSRGDLALFLQARSLRVRGEQCKLPSVWGCFLSLSYSC